MNDTFSERNLWQTLLSATNVKIFWKDANRRFVGANKSFLDYYGFESVNEILGKTDEDMGWHIDPDPFRNEECQVLANGEASYDVPGTCIIKGQIRHIQATKLPLHNEHGQIEGLVGYFIDVTDYMAETEQLYHQIRTDELTGLSNRTGLMEAAKEYIAEYEKKGRDFAILFLDIDQFKSINDTYGHDFGDKYLQTIALELLKIAGNSSVVARYGGDEFIILRQIPELNSSSLLNNSILSMIEHIRLKQSEAHLINNHFLRSGISIGWASYSEATNIQEAIKLADSRMYEEKAEN